MDCCMVGTFWFLHKLAFTNFMLSKCIAESTRQRKDGLLQMYPHLPPQIEKIWVALCNRLCHRQPTASLPYPWLIHFLGKHFPQKNSIGRVVEFRRDGLNWMLFPEDMIGGWDCSSSSHSHLWHQWYLTTLQPPPMKAEPTWTPSMTSSETRQHLPSTGLTRLPLHWMTLLCFLLLGPPNLQVREHTTAKKHS